MSLTKGLLYPSVPLTMAAICIAFGLWCWLSAESADYFVAGHVVTFISAVCLALFATAATMILQNLGRFGRVHRIGLPTFAYLVAVGTIGFGLHERVHASDGFIAGHVVFGLGLISLCVATVAMVCTRFTLLPESARLTPGAAPPRRAFSLATGRTLITLPVVAALSAWAVAILLLLDATDQERFVAGHVLAGQAAICTIIASLVASLVRQIRNTYGQVDARLWPRFGFMLGTLTLVWGIGLVVLHRRPEWMTTGFVMIGLGFVSYAITSKVAVLALMWRRPPPIPDWAPLIPVLMALASLFLAAFLFQAAVSDSVFFIPARVLTGLAAICFSLFPIVSTLPVAPALARAHLCDPASVEQSPRGRII